MMNKFDKNFDYYLGIDIGTASVGWAATDQYGKLLKKGNNPMWGYNIFEEAQTAKSRRNFRGSRRRLERRKQRVHLLQDLCAPMIGDVDPGFYHKLTNSYLSEEENDPNIFEYVEEEKDFYKKYPTIYHLRSKLCTNEEKEDARLVYLALHHIVKYRGNFLYEGQELAANSLSKCVDDLNDILNYFEFNSDDLSAKILAIFSNDSITNKDKVKNIQELSNDKEEKIILKEIANAIAGYKFKVNSLFELDEDLSMKFSDADIEEKKDKLETTLGEDVEIILLLENIYGAVVLKDILSDCGSISDAMIKKYKKHKKDLQLLKKLAIENGKKQEILNDKTGCYQLYVKAGGFIKEKGKKGKKLKRLNQDDFYKEVLKLITKGDEKDLTYLKNEIENGTFMPLINSTLNGAIPYQLHRDELLKIINNQEKFYPCLQKNKDKIISLIEFRIPYYIGPLNENATNAWMTRKDPNNKEAIRPWNWKEIIDVEKTAEDFINKMRGHCTYLIAEKALPKNSMLLQRFNLLNELNKVSFDGKHLDASSKDRIIEDLFKKKNEVKEKDFKKWLFDNQLINSKDCVITGLQKDKAFASSLSSENKFREIFKEEFETNKDKIERIIELISVYDNKEIIKTRLLKDGLCNEEQLEKILKLKFKGYGRFSKKLIDEFLCRNTYKNIIQIMEETNKNFMEIINDSNYGFMDLINEFNNGEDDFDVKDRINELATSPALKRGILQTIKVVQDIVDYLGHEPKKVFIEFAREEGKKKRTDSRASKLKKIYKEYYKKTTVAEELKSNEKNLSDDRLLLYFLQEGKCLYSGRSLDIKRLSDYQIDHILPQSYLKDDSIDNKALVYPKENQRKKDSLLLDKKIIENQQSWWDKLHDYNLMSDKKYKNLCRLEVSDKEKMKFVSRQLVITRQICVHVRELLSVLYPKTKVNVVHANLSSEFRNKNELFKIRSLNYSHHAQDAYLSIVIGNFIDCKYYFINSQDDRSMRFIKSEFEKRLKEENKLDKETQSMDSFVIHQLGARPISDRNGEIVWEGQEQLDYIKKIFYYKNYFFNHMSYVYDGLLYKMNILSKEEAQNQRLVPIKNGRDPKLYGGFQQLNTAFIAAVRYKKGNKTLNKLIAIPVYYSRENEMNEYLHMELDTNEFELLRKIPLNQTIMSEGCLFTLISDSEWHLKEQIYLDSLITKKLYYITKGKHNSLKENDYLEVLLALLNQLYIRVPRIRNSLKKDNAKGFMFLKEDFKGGSITKNSLSEQFINNFNLAKAEDKAKLINDLLNQILGKNTKLEINNIEMTKRFKRYSSMPTDFSKFDFVYTSPSGIHRIIKKL